MIKIKRIHFLDGVAGDADRWNWSGTWSGVDARLAGCWPPDARCRDHRRQPPEPTEREREGDSQVVVLLDPSKALTGDGAVVAVRRGEARRGCKGFPGAAVTSYQLPPTE